MKIFWTKKQYNQFKDLLVKRSFEAGEKKGIKKGREAGIASGIRAIRENYILEKKENKKNV